MKIIRLAVCSDDRLDQVMKSGAETYQAYSGCRIEQEFFRYREDLLYRMQEQTFDLVFVVMNGAMGMETAMGVRDLSADVPLIWVSNEQEFVPQSYRIHVSLFLLKPLTQTKVLQAIERCYPTDNNRFNPAPLPGYLANERKQFS